MHFRLRRDELDKRRGQKSTLYQFTDHCIAGAAKAASASAAIARLVTTSVPTMNSMHLTCRDQRPPLKAVLQRVSGATAVLLVPLQALAADGFDARHLNAVPWPALLLLAAAAVIAWRGWQRWQAQAEQLRQTRVELRALVELADVWHWRTDRQHRLQWLRPPSKAADGAWRAPWQHGLAWDFFQADDSAAWRARFEAHAALCDVAVRFSAGGDRPVQAQLSAVVLCNARGQFDGYQGVARPAAAMVVVAPLPVEAGDSQLDAADSESFTYTVSHDLRAPIRVVEGFTRILKEDYGHLLDRIGNDHLDRVLGAAARMSSMIDALLALSQLSARPLARQPVNLSQLAGFVADDLRRHSPREHEIELHIEPGMSVLGDPTLLRIVLENLLGNAWKYTGKCRQPAVWFERHPQQLQYTYTVRDNGAGFDMRFADRLFGVFQRLHSANDFQGTGVGLASVRRIIRRHGGEIWAESEVDRGASFHFSLPSASGR